MLDTNCRENQNTHFVFNTVWKNIVEPGRSQMTIRRMRIACWIPKATNMYSEYVILIAFPLQQRLHERASLLRYTYIACLVYLFVFKKCYIYFISMKTSTDSVNAKLLSCNLKVSHLLHVGTYNLQTVFHTVLRSND